LLTPLLGGCAPDGHDRSLIATGMAPKWPGNYQPDHSAAPGVGRPESSDLLPAFVTGAAR
jgi:hypothetical protein